VTDAFVSYAQHHEDVVLARALCPNRTTGFWIDVGAGDPIEGSVTAAFAERGWRGVNIEPRPEAYERLRAARPRDTNLQLDLGADADGATLAGVVAEHAPDRVDFLRVDAGCARALLDGAEWTSLRPRIVVVTRAAQPPDEWEPFLIEQGYRPTPFDGQTRFYASGDEPELADLLAAPANVNDHFVPYLWRHELEAASTLARLHADRAEIAFDQVSQMRDDLDAAQRITAQALDALRAAQRDAAAAHAAAAELDELRRAHDALLDTKLYRFTAPIRRLYGRLTRRLRRHAT
jgi:hypothetical protein